MVWRESMTQNPPIAFGEAHAAAYDEKSAALAPMRDALHLLINAVLADLPANARILCVGAGTGQELIYLAQKFPGWHFAAVEPSAPMLEVCRRKAEAAGIMGRCEFHQGYLDSLPATGPFDAATSLLVSHFILTPEARSSFFRSIAERLFADGYLITADLASDTTTAAYESLLKVWFHLMQKTGLPRDQFERLRATYQREVAVLPVEQVSDIISSGGFAAPVQFLQTGLIHAWYARRI